MRIALVDDAAVSRALFVRIAGELRHHVVVVPTAADDDGASDVVAMAAAVRQSDPEIVVLDGRLADPRGTRLAAPTELIVALDLFRGAVPHAIVGVVAAFGETTLVRAATAAGAGFVVTRPYLRSQVGTTLSALVAARGSASP